MKKNDLYMISGTEYKEMTKEILAQSDLWAEIKKKADQKQKNADQMLIGIKPNLVSPTEASYGATTHPEIVAGIIEYLQERSCQHIVMLESSWVGDKTSESMEVCGYDRLVEKYNVFFDRTGNFFLTSCNFKDFCMKQNSFRCLDCYILF